jgi:hypothetical protein
MGSESDLSMQATNIKQFHLDDNMHEDVVGGGQFRGQNYEFDDSAAKPINTEKELNREVNTSVLDP